MKDIDKIKALHDQRPFRDDHRSKDLARTGEEAALPRTSVGLLRMGQVCESSKAALRLRTQRGRSLACADLWDAWRDQGGHWLQSFAIVTTEANELMAPIHPRTPVILHERDYDR